MFSGSVAENIAFGRPDATRAGDRSGRPRGRGRRRGLAPAQRLRRECRQERLAPVGRPAPADRARPGAARRSGGPDPRRGELVARRADRAAGPERAEDRARGPDRADHRAPAVDGRDRRPGAGHGGRPDHRGRDAAGAARGRLRASTPRSPRHGGRAWSDPAPVGRGRQTVVCRRWIRA